MNFSKYLNKKNILIALVLLIGFGSLVTYSLTKNKTPKKIYKRVQVSRDLVEVMILSTGVVQPENRLEIKPPVAGRVEKVLVAEGDHVQKGQEIAIMSSTERAALIDAARGEGPQELKKWEEYYKPTPIIAPISGMIISRKVEPGQSFASNDPVLVMSDRLSIKAQVDETDISQVKLKQKATIELDAYPGQSFEAVVDQIAYEAKTISSVTTYIVDVLPLKTPEFMRSGMTANVNFYVNSKPNVLVLPSYAIKTKDGHSTVMVDESDPHEVDVQIGATDGKKTEIVSGLKEGDEVLVADMKNLLTAPTNSSAFGVPGGVKKK